MTTRKTSTITPLEGLTTHIEALIQDCDIVPEAHRGKGSAQDALWANCDKSMSIGWVPAQGPFQAGDDGTHYWMATIAKGRPAFAIIRHTRESVTRKGEKITITAKYAEAIVTFSDQEAFDEAHKDLRSKLTAVTIADGEDILASFMK